MNPKVSAKRENDDILTFTLSECNVSIANALRRTILSDIKCVVFHTFPYSENNCTIEKNTSRFNNEIIKHRLCCVPIHITDLTIPIENYLLVVNKKNESGMIEHVTTEDFQIKDIQTDKFLSKSDRDSIFPSNTITGYYIDFLRLRPKLSTNLDGEELSLTCKFSISTAKENSAYNQCSKCLYTNTVDAVAANDMWMKKEKLLKEQGMSSDDIAFEKKNWFLLDGNRVFTKDSFDFKIKTIGVFENTVLVKYACDVLIDSFGSIKQSVEINNTDVVEFKNSKTTIPFSYDVVFHNYDYTIGKVIEYFTYKDHFIGGTKMLSFCGFIKEHPHDSFSILRLAFKNETDVGVVKQIMGEALNKSMETISEIKDAF
jgi:DNA-directed RNA polymerase subunit L